MITMRPTAATEKDFAERVKAIADLARPDPALVDIVQQGLLAGFAENFATESAGGVRWAKLSEYTVRDRLRRGFAAGPIMVRTGEYRSTWIDAGNASHVHEVRQQGRGWSVEEGSASEKSAELELGRDRMPPRPVAVLSQGAKDELTREVNLYLLKKLVSR